MSKKKRHHHEEHEEHVNHEAWVIPYADMLTLLMAMFLVLWAIGQVDIDKAKAVSTGFADEFGLSMSAGKGSGGTGVMDGAGSWKDDPVATRSKPDKTAAIAAYRREEQAREQRDEAEQQLQQVADKISSDAAAEGLAAAIRFKMEARGLVVSIVSEGVLFDAGSAELRPAGKVVLDGVSASLVDVPNQLSIEGHTDDRPISTSQFPSNWELSTARATTVLRYLVDRHGIPSNRVGAVGYADQRPVAPNSTDGGRAKNRRVDVVVLMTTDAANGTKNLAAADQAADEAKSAAAPTPAPASGGGK